MTDTRARGERILIVEDSPTVQLRLRVGLQRAGFEDVRVAGTGVEGIELVGSFRPACMLLDFYLPDMTGREVVRRVREFDDAVQIVLVTGRGDEQPARDSMREFDIQGYHHKSAGLSSLLIWVESALKAFRRNALLAQHAARLRHVVRAMEDIHRLQPPTELLATALRHAVGMLMAREHPTDPDEATGDSGSADAVDAPEHDTTDGRPRGSRGGARRQTTGPNGRAARASAERPSSESGVLHLDLPDVVGTESSWSGVALRFDVDLSAGVVATAGRFAGLVRVEDLPLEARALLRGLIDRRLPTTRGAFIGVPLHVGSQAAGALLLENETVEIQRTLRDASEYLKLLATQVMVALDNIRLYEMATVDPLTALVSRGHVLQRLVEWLKIAVRKGEALSLIYLDMDELKPVNDSYGHAAGDALLAALGSRIQESIRDADLAGRMGGDEFLVVLPSAGPKIATRVALRIRNALVSRPVEVAGRELDLHASLGCGGFDSLSLDRWMRAGPRNAAWQRLALQFIEQVDAACYDAKASGGNQVALAGDDGDLSTVLSQYIAVDEADEAEPVTDATQSRVS